MLREQPVAIPWYKAEEYDRVRDLMADSERLPSRYDAWHRRALALSAHLQGLGLSASPVELDAEPFLDWCHALGRRPDETARVQYANDRLCVARDHP